MVTMMASRMRQFLNAFLAVSLNTALDLVNIKSACLLVGD